MTYLGKKILAVVPARGGSKGIPRKNLKKVCGKSLINHAAQICKSLSWIDCSILSTDDHEMAEEGKKYGLKIPFLRPKDLASDNTNSIDMWRHAWLETENKMKTKFDISILLEPTSPMRRKEDIENCINYLIKKNHSGVATVSLMPAHFRPQKTLKINEKGMIEFYLQNDNSYSLRQNIPKYYYRNGICYALTRKKLINDKTIIDESIYAMQITREVVNIDEPFDLELAEILLNRL
tara:strand:+ start:203 stop:910 length:708 start_codon:yes stop_codon:yes gene_type:complete